MKALRHLSFHKYSRYSDCSIMKFMENANFSDFYGCFLPEMFCLKLHAESMHCTWPTESPGILSRYRKVSRNIDRFVMRKNFWKWKRCRLRPFLSLLRSHLPECFHSTGTDRSRCRVQAFTSIEITSWCNSVTGVGSFHPCSVASNGLGENTFSFDVTLREASTL
jgi:hypothetical protein